MMRITCPRRFFIFASLAWLGLHGTLSLAAPTSNVRPDEYSDASTRKAEEKSEMGNRLDPESIFITPQKGSIDPHELDRIRATRIVRKQTSNISVGLWSGQLEEKKAAVSTFVFSATQTFLDSDESANEYGVDVTAQSLFGFHWQHKKYCCLGEWTEPYWSLGGGGLYQPNDLLAGFVKLSSYQLQAGVGFEDLFKMQRRMRGEFLVAQSLIGTSFLLRFGYAFDEFLNF